MKIAENYPSRNIVLPTLKLFKTHFSKISWKFLANPTFYLGKL